MKHMKGGAHSATTGVSLGGDTCVATADRFAALAPWRGALREKTTDTVDASK